VEEKMTAPAIIDQVLAAVNAGDTSAFLDLFLESGSVDDWGSIYRGPDQIRTWSDRELIGVNAHFDLRSSDQHGDIASMMVEVGGDGFKGPSRFTFTLEGDRIRQMKITAD
jgi:hypothetical protein